MTPARLAEIAQVATTTEIHGRLPGPSSQALQEAACVIRELLNALEAASVVDEEVRLANEILTLRSIAKGPLSERVRSLALREARTERRAERPAPRSKKKPDEADRPPATGGPSGEDR